ncbi:MAG: DegV family protein [Thermosipho sp. (in: Bacteria)]|nr:DegV family protein [Thermosipho sp. (in: thermotogales)]
MIKIITDSASDLPKKFIENYNIEIVPLTVEVEGKIYSDGVDISPTQFYKLMSESKTLPKTSRPSPELFRKVFEKYTKLGYDLLCLTISSKLSGTFQAANLAKNMQKYDKNIEIFDTLGASSGEGLQVIKAAELASQGYKLSKIIEILNSYRKEMNILILLDTLENIVKGGRLSRTKGIIGKILNFKIILQGVDGAVEMLEKVRGKKKFFEKVLKIIEEKRKNLSEKIVGITHVNNQEDAEYFKKVIEEKFNPKDIYINYMGATLATYAGKGGIIISF